jgi:hypothetical protein
MPPIPSLTYGSSVANAYIQIAQILKWAIASPRPANRLPPVSNQRVPMATPPVPEQRALAQPPPLLAFPLPDPPKVHPVPKKQPLPNRPPIPPRQSRRTIRPPSCSSHGPLAQAATVNPYARHVAALVTTPPTSGKQGSIRKLLHGPNSKVWERGLANEWGRLLPQGIGTTCPPLRTNQRHGHHFLHHEVPNPSRHLCKLRVQYSPPEIRNLLSPNDRRRRQARLPRRRQFAHRLHARRQAPHQQHHFRCKVW